MSFCLATNVTWGDLFRNSLEGEGAWKINQTYSLDLIKSMYESLSMPISVTGITMKLDQFVYTNTNMGCH